MITVIIPAYNEGATIRTTVERLREVMDATQIVYELIVVNDGSRDDTREHAEATGVRVISHPTNGGYGRALKTGIRSAAYDWCAIVDADASYPIERLPDLIALVPEFDMVVGARTGSHYWGSFSKRLSRLLLLRVVSFVVGRDIPDVNSGFRVFRKATALAHIQRVSSGFSFTTTITLAFLLSENFVKYVPIDYHKREGKSKVKMGRDSLRMIQIVASAILYYNPLKLFLMVCLFSAALAVVLALLCLLFAPGFAFPALILGAFTTVLLGGMGLIAEALRVGRL